MTEKIFLDSKLRLLDKAVHETRVQGDSNVKITLDNNKAFASQNRAERFDRDKDPSVSECLFVQLSKELHQKPSSTLQHDIDSKGRMFYVTFRGEEGLDWGGVYRETLTRATADLFAPYFSLNIPCPNRVHGQVDNADRFLPNPSSTNPSSLGQLEFVGKLMGVALRTKNYLEFQYAPIVWKLLVGQIPTESDVTMIDTTTMEHIERIRSWEDATTFHALHDDEDVFFTVKSADGTMVEVIESGSTIQLTFENRKYYAKKAIEVRLREFDVQCRAILRGLTSVVPQRALQLFTGAELEILICGDSKIEVDQLKKHATYHGWTEKDEGAKRFWRAFEKLTYKERSGLVRFAWGRSRLPKEEDWSTHGSPFKLTKKNGGDAAGYPLAHTCFFQLKYPCTRRTPLRCRS